MATQTRRYLLACIPSSTSASSLTWRIQSRFATNWGGSRGFDLTQESIDDSVHASYGPKVIVDGYGPSGFDVLNMMKRVDLDFQSDAALHMYGSIMVFPHGCFLWNVSLPTDVTFESLSAVLLHRNPDPVEMLFIGSNYDIPNFSSIERAFATRQIAVERHRLLNAIGTFNILNAESRHVAAALLIDPNEKDE